MVIRMSIVEESMSFEWEHTTPLALEVEESLVGVAMVTGTLLSEGLSKNGNLYTIEEMEQIAETAKGAPIYYGTMTKVLNGRLVRNAHANIEETRVGNITETWVDKLAKKIKFRAHIIDNPKFPNLIDCVKKGWGVSVGGKALGQKFVDAAGRTITKIFNMFVNHVQLLEPDTPRGQDEAQVEHAEPKQYIEESMWLEVVPQKIHIHISL